MTEIDTAFSERVKAVIIKVLDLDVTPEQMPDDLPLYSTTIRLNSLTLLQLITELEEVFSCRIDDEAVMMADLVDVASIVRLLATQLNPEPQRKIDGAKGIKEPRSQRL